MFDEITENAMSDQEILGNGKYSVLICDGYNGMPFSQAGDDYIYQWEDSSGNSFKKQNLNGCMNDSEASKIAKESGYTVDEWGPHTIVGTSQF